MRTCPHWLAHVLWQRKYLQMKLAWQATEKYQISPRCCRRTVTRWLWWSDVVGLKNWFVLLHWEQLDLQSYMMTCRYICKEKPAAPTCLIYVPFTTVERMQWRWTSQKRFWADGHLKILSHWHRQAMPVRYERKWSHESILRKATVVQNVTPPAAYSDKVSPTRKAWMPMDRTAALTLKTPRKLKMGYLCTAAKQTGWLKFAWRRSMWVSLLLHCSSPRCAADHFLYQQNHL